MEAVDHYDVLTIFNVGDSSEHKQNRGREKEIICQIPSPIAIFVKKSQKQGDRLLELLKKCER